jgi:hypothetical protein
LAIFVIGYRAGFIDESDGKRQHENIPEAQILGLALIKEIFYG